MTIRTLSVLGLLATALLAATPGLADGGKTIDASVEKLDVKEGKVRAAVLSGANQNVLPGDKGFFVKDGVKVADSDFEVDRVDDRLAYLMTGFSTPEDLRARTSSKARITTTHTCHRGGGVRPSFDDKDVAQGNAPAEGFAFAKVTSVERVHKTQIAFTIDKGTDDGVMPSSAAYGLAAGPGRPLAWYVHMDWVTAKTAGGTVDAGDAEQMLKTVKRIGYQRVACKPAK